MLKPILMVLAGTLFVIAPAASQGGQDTAPAPAPAPAQTQSPAPAPAANPAPAMAPAPAAVPTPAVTYPKNPVKPTADSQAKAKTLYGIDCSMCHGDNGNGKTDLATSMGLTLMDWTDPKSLAGREDGELFNVIRNGNNKMPPESEGRAKDDQIWNLIYYIRGFSKAGAAAGNPK
ncbi:MAG: cytochrome c [Terracidiphilus sp.]